MNEQNLENLFDIPTSFEQEADAKNPWGDDVLQRKQFADKLTTQVKGIGDSSTSSFVISIHGGWGTGKTFMLQRWRQQLRNEHRMTVYFNAWEDDFHANPLVAIIGQLWKNIKGKDRQEIIKSASEAFSSVTEKIALGYFGLQKEDFQSTAEKTVAKYVNSRKKLEDFRTRLTEFSAAVKKETNFPLVFIVDELDRCRPTFAIELLERIKHIFNVPNVVFVFGLNKTELKESIKRVYGGINTEEYLHRFFDIELNLPPASPSNYCIYRLGGILQSLEQYYKKNPPKDSYMPVHERNPYTHDNWKKAINEFYAPMTNRMGFSLRQVEHSIRLFMLFLNAQKESTYIGGKELWSVISLILIRIHDRNLYWEFVNGQKTCKEIADYLTAIFPKDKNNITFDIAMGIHKLAEGSERENINNEMEFLCQGLRRGDLYSASHYKTIAESIAVIKNPDTLEFTWKRLNNSYEHNDRWSLKDIAGLFDLVD